MSEFGPTGNEQEKTVERTKESEIKANVEFWQELGFEVDEEDVRSEIEAIPEVKGFDWYIFSPKDVKLSEVWNKFKEKHQDYSKITRQLTEESVEEINEPRFLDKNYAVAARYQQEPDWDSIDGNGKPAPEWKRSRETFMNPLERMIYGMRWYSENGTHLDQEHATLFPQEEYYDGFTHHNNVRAIGEKRNFGISSALLSYVKNTDPTGRPRPELGVRRVITSETKIETEK